MLVLHYSLTGEDHYKFNFYRYWQSPDARKRRLKLYFKFVLALVIGFSLFHRVMGNPLTVADIIIYSAVTLIFILFLPEFYKAHIRRQVNKLLSDPNNRSYISPTELTINDQGILNKDESSQTSYEWRAILKQEESKDHYYLYVSSILVITIPKRALNQEEKKQLDFYFSKHISLQAAFTSLLDNV